jgi:uncharacterized membrane protein YfhO
MQLAHSRKKDKDALKRLVLLSGLVGLAIFLPFIISDGGRLSLVSDFNHQEIPFNIHSNWAIKNGAVRWDWYTDLGVNFIGAFSFYTLGSPFFWLYMLFPPYSFHYLIGWFYILKYMTIATTAFLWLKTHVENADYAVIGALLYAFSGFSHINMMFYHFHEVIAFFPLLLYALDRLVLDGKRGLFALVTALCALLNYFFFFGEVLFLVLYFLFVYRFESKRKFKESLLKVIGEGFLGVLASCILLLPSLLFIVNSPKADNFLSVQDLWIYSPKRYLAIIKAFLFPAESMVVQSGPFSSDYSSSSLYLPAVGISLAFASFTGKSKFRRLMIVLFLFAFIPFLSSAFTLFNSFYYARWFYMPLLILSAMSIKAIENEGTKRILRSVKIVFILTIVYTVLQVFLYFFDPSIISSVIPFVTTAFVSFAGLFMTYRILKRKREKQIRSFVLLTSAFSIISGIYGMILIRSYNPAETRDFSKGYLMETAKFDLVPEEEKNTQNYRTYSYDPFWNLSMLNRIPSINSYITTYSPSVTEFFETVGITRNAASLFPEDPDDILTFLSVRYRLDTEEYAGYKTLYRKSNGSKTIYVSENPNFIPLGYPVEYYVTKTELLNYPKKDRAKVLISAAVIPDDEEPAENLKPYNLQAFREPVNQLAQTKREQAVTDFTRDTNGFSGKITVDSAKTILFTVPWDKGWRAQIDGQEVPIKNSLGFMIIQVPEGSHTIRFQYRIPGGRLGIVFSVIGFMSIFLLFFRKSKVLRQIDDTKI